jgi:Ca-activated chloride channel family protein
MKRLAILSLLLSALFATGGCNDDSSSSSSAPPPPPKPNVPTTELTFTYGSEKESWVKAQTELFNGAQKKTAAGNIIHVDAIPMGSGDTIDEVLNGRRQSHLVSPASAAFIEIGNTQSKAKTGKELVSKPTNLVLSPVVIAMWKPMAETLGYGTKPIGWQEIIAVANDPKGWESLGHGEWGAFKFGHTHPEYSNSGLISVLAETYAGAGKKAGLKLSDVNSKDTTQFLGAIEKSVVHYGTSTGFFAKKMFAKGPEYLSAAVLYESNVIESQGQSVMPLVAVYPKEGTFWSDHPIGIVNREWVTKEHQDAAKVYIDFLTAEPAQKSAMDFGFRPADPNITLSDKFSKANGVDPAEPKTTLEVPSAQVLQGVIDVWKQNKKPANIVLVFDTSGSMNEENRIGNARQGALEFTSMLNPNDLLSFMPFNTKSSWRLQGASVGRDATKINGEIGAVFAGGGTALYDAISSAQTYIKQNPRPGYINAVVVMTDGADTDSGTNLDTLCAILAPQANRTSSEVSEESVKVFTIGYGSGAKMDVLKRISEATTRKSTRGPTKTFERCSRKLPRSSKRSARHNRVKGSDHEQQLRTKRPRHQHCR